MADITLEGWVDIMYRALDATEVAEAPWSVAEWAVAPRFDNPRATVLVLLVGDTPLITSFWVPNALNTL